MRRGRYFLGGSLSRTDYCDTPAFRIVSAKKGGLTGVIPIRNILGALSRSVTRQLFKERIWELELLSWVGLDLYNPTLWLAALGGKARGSSPEVDSGTGREN
jgi:hypothetical protein